jgi:uncharacterized membrane protein YfcA
MKIVAGTSCLLMAIASFWVGSYLTSLFGDDDWQRVPVIATSFIVVFFWMCAALHNFSSQKS